MTLFGTFLGTSERAGLGRREVPEGTDRWLGPPSPRAGFWRAGDGGSWSGWGTTWVLPAALKEWVPPRVDVDGPVPSSELAFTSMAAECSRCLPYQSWCP